MKIGNIELKNNLILAPMAGVTDLPFRRICEKYGEPGMVCTEMISSKGLFYNDHKTERILNTEGEPKPVSCQIFGSDPETMEYATNLLCTKYRDQVDIIDINMGCPVPKVVKSGDGSKLLTDLDKAEEIIKVVVKKSTVPVTVKMRTGWDKNNIVAPELAKRAEATGTSAITIHGRTRSEFYGGKANLDEIKKVKDAVKIPVIGNGDVIDEQSAKYMLEYTGVDGIMIGRGTFGNPWIFKRINYYLQTGKYLPEITIQEKLDVILEHIELTESIKGENALKELRKHIAWYTKNLKNSSEFRNSINKIEDKQELIKTVKEYFITLQ